MVVKVWKEEKNEPLRTQRTQSQEVLRELWGRESGGNNTVKRHYLIVVD
ncbi:hypothetical protein NSP_5480 [Nodularia spumigena CCY9414]|nr:hypothetical protein NSP_5480 [Nodularia spumigena CCY9414]